VVKIDLTSNIQKQLANATDFATKRKLVKDYIMTELRGKYNAKDGVEIAIGTVSAKKYSNVMTDTKIKVAPHLAEAIQQSIFIGFGNERKNHEYIGKWAYYECDLDVGGKVYVGRLNIAIMNNEESMLYDINPIKEK